MLVSLYRNNIQRREPGIDTGKVSRIQVHPRHVREAVYPRALLPFRLLLPGIVRVICIRVVRIQSPVRAHILLNHIPFSCAVPQQVLPLFIREIAAVIKENSAIYKGVDVEIVSYREYTDGSIAPHILGVTGVINAEEYEELKSEG